MADIDHSQDLVDRISDLPDSILSHILCFLPTKDSVATSIISQRWKFLWRAVSNFDFCNVDALCKLEDIDDNSNIDRDSRDGQIEANLVKFISFVNNVLHLRLAGSIDNFSLVWKAQHIPSNVNPWINTAIDNKVQNLFIDIFGRSSGLDFELTPRIFSCESLHFLELNCNGVIHSAANVVSLPRLEFLKLSLRFQDKEAFQKLILGCPMLKFLSIYTPVVDNKDVDEDMQFDRNVFKFMVYSTSLRYLDLEVVGNLPDTCYSSLEIEAPSLKVLRLTHCISRIFLKGSLSSLVEVYFEINQFVIGGDDISEYSCDYVVEVVRAFSCAKSLTLSNNVLRALSLAGIDLSTEFKRLTKFWIRSDYVFWDSLQDTMNFIRCSDSLEHIVFEKRFYDESMGEGIGWEYPDQVPICLKNSLKLVMFYAFEGYEDEMEMVEYLLKHGSVLSAVHIHVCVKPCYDHTKKLQMVQQISNFSRKSSACELHFV